MSHMKVMLYLVINLVALSSSEVKAQSAVTITGTLQSELTLNTEDLPFAFTITNANGTTAIDKIHFVSIPREYRLDELCSPNCRRTTELQASGNLITEKINAGAKIAIWGRLSPLSSHRKQKITIIVGWNQDGHQNTLLAALGENEVQTNRRFDYLNYLYGPFKALAIPLTLAIVGYLLNRHAKKREEARADADKEQSIRTEIWKLMLPISHKCASKYYLPIAGAAARANDALVKYAEATFLSSPPSINTFESARRAFFYLLLLDLRLRHTKKVIGGFIFKDLRGEDLAVGCLQRYRLELVGETESQLDLKFMKSADLLKFQGTYPGFQKEFCDPINTGSPPNDMVDSMEGTWVEFRKWLNEQDRVLRSILYIRGLTAVLDYEINRPYEYWYKPGPAVRQDREDVPEKVLAALYQSKKFPATTLLEVLQNVGKEEKIEELDDYLTTAFCSKLRSSKCWYTRDLHENPLYKKIVSKNIIQYKF